MRQRSARYSVRGWSKTSRVTVVVLAAAIVAASTPSTVRAQTTFNGKGALIGGLVGAGIGLAGWAITRSRDSDFRITPKGLNLGDARVGEHVDRAVVVRNTGTDRLQLDSVTISNTAFTIVGPSPYPVTLQPGAEQSITIRFTPSASQRSSGTVEIRMTRSRGRPITVTARVNGRGRV